MEGETEGTVELLVVGAFDGHLVEGANEDFLVGRMVKPDVDRTVVRALGVVDGLIEGFDVD